MLTRRFLTVKEVADLVQVSEASVRHWIKLQQLRAIDLGREWRIIPRDLEAFLATHETRHAAGIMPEAGGGTGPVAACLRDASSGLIDRLSQPDGSRRRPSSGAVTQEPGRSREKRDAGL